MFLYFLWENKETRHKSIKEKMYYFKKNFPDISSVSMKPIRDFYRKRARLSYKKITIREPKKKVNYAALTGFLKCIKQKLDKDYLLFSLDETSFGIEDLRRYGWGRIGEKVSHKFSAMQSLTLLCCISPTGVVAYQFCKGGNNRIVFEGFL
jgi:hypothetical protein